MIEPSALPQRILNGYSDMPRGERRLADVLLEDGTAILESSATELAAWSVGGGGAWPSGCCMTIGIAVAGPKAGLAAFAALRAVERVGRGAIGGFVSFAAIGASKRLLRAETQRGGTTTLFASGEMTGVGPPANIAEARLAVLMSSGPDRPCPLAQFTPADRAVGLVTGHRLPNAPGNEGRTLNTLVLQCMAEGDTPQLAVERVLATNPDSDAGLIALGIDGGIYAANSELVSRRPDIGHAMFEDRQQGLAVAVLHNAIHPHHGLADLAVRAAIDQIASMDDHDFVVRLEAGTVLELGAENCLFVDAAQRVERITVAQPRWISASCQGAAVGLSAAVRCGGVLVGRTVSEPYCVAVNGQLQSVSGHSSAPVQVRQESR